MEDEDVKQLPVEGDDLEPSNSAYVGPIEGELPIDPSEPVIETSSESPAQEGLLVDPFPAEYYSLRKVAQEILDKAKKHTIGASVAEIEVDLLEQLKKVLS